MEGLEGVEEQRRRGKEGLKLLLLFVKVKVLSLSTFRIIIFCGFCFLFSAWWGLSGAESTRNVQINLIQKNKPLIAVQRKRYWSLMREFQINSRHNANIFSVFEDILTAPAQVTESIYDLMGSELPPSHRMDEIFSNMDSNRFINYIISRQLSNPIFIYCKFLDRCVKRLGFFIRFPNPPSLAGYLPIIELGPQIDDRENLGGTVFSEGFNRPWQDRKIWKEDQI